MPSSEGFVQAYNAQASVDTSSHLIVGNHITQQPNDKQQIEPALAQLNEIEASLGKPEGLLADAGYYSEESIKRCDKASITPYISDSRERHNCPLEERFKSQSPCPEDADAVTAMIYRDYVASKVKQSTLNVNPRWKLCSVLSKKCWGFGVFTFVD